MIEMTMADRLALTAVFGPERRQGAVLCGIDYDGATTREDLSGLALALCVKAGQVEGEVGGWRHVPGIGEMASIEVLRATQ